MKELKNNNLANSSYYYVYNVKPDVTVMQVTHNHGRS